jgi:hypothetical protein
MAILGYLIPETSTQTIETFHGLRRTTEGLLYYTKLNKDTTTTIDLSNGQPGDTQLPTSGSYVDADETLSSVQYFTGNGSTLTYTLVPPVLDGTRIKVYVNNVEQTFLTSYTYTSPTLTFIVAPFNNAQIAVGIKDKEYKNNTSDLYQQYIFEDGEATYFIDSDGYLVKRENLNKVLTPLVSDDFNTFESTATVNATTYSI